MQIIIVLLFILLPEPALAGEVLSTALQIGAVIAAALGAPWVAAALAIASGLIAQITAPKPGFDPVGGIELNNYGSAEPTQIIYGTFRVGGVVIYDEATDTTNVPGGRDIPNPELNRIIVFSEHEIVDFQEVYAANQLLTIRPADGGVSNYPSTERAIITEGGGQHYALQIHEHKGTSSQAADSRLTNVSDGLWTSQHRLQGCSYIYARMLEDENYDRFDGGVPVVITALIRGKKIPDLRKATFSQSVTHFTDNAASCILDLLLSYPELDIAIADIDIASFKTAYTHCETYGYSINGAYRSNNVPADLLGAMTQACAGVLWYGRGKWRLRVGVWIAPTVSFDEDDIISELSVTNGNPAREEFNIVRGQYSGPTTEYVKSDYPTVRVNSYIIADGHESSFSLDLPFVDDPKIAFKIANIVLEKSRRRIKVQAMFNMNAYKVSVGDNIMLSNSRYGWNRKIFEVVDWRLSLSQDRLGVQMSLVETSSSIYNQTATYTAPR